MDLEDVVYWLREGEEWKAAELLSQCEFTYEYIDTGFAISGESEITIVDLKIHAPRRILSNVTKDSSEQVSLIENAISACAQSEQLYIQNIHWVARLRPSSAFPADQDTELTIDQINSKYIKSTWSKALLRRRTDSDGAITTAKTLIEAVCKHILTDLSVMYSHDLDINQLYSLVSKQLNLSPEQYMDKNIKRILGNCQAIIGGIAFLRNRLGDAHAMNSNAFIPGEDEAELAVNLSGTIATFLIKIWRRQKQENIEKTNQSNRNDLPQ